MCGAKPTQIGLEKIFQGPLGKILTLPGIADIAILRFLSQKVQDYGIFYGPDIEFH